MCFGAECVTSIRIPQAKSRLLIQRTANARMSTIHQIVQDSITFTDHLYKIQSIELSSLFLIYFQKGLEKEMSNLKVQLEINANLSEASCLRSVLTDECLTKTDR
jgi:hypothetical protein